MIFQFSIGTEGAPRESYSIRIPVTLPPGQKLEIGNGVCFAIGSIRIEIVPETYFYSLTIREFGSQHEATLWLGKFSVALLWMIAKLRIGLMFDGDDEEVELREPPILVSAQSPFAEVLIPSGWEEIDGFYQADKTVIKPEHKRLIQNLVGRPSNITWNLNGEPISE